MALTGIQIFKLLPKTNCGKCKFPTCLAFAMALASAKAELDACPDVSDEARAELSDASAPPIRPLSVGTGDYEVKVGGETVQFRHEKTFFNKPGLAILVTDAMDDGEIDAKLAKLSRYQFERIGLTLCPEMVAIQHTGNNERFLAIVQKACSGPYAIILMSTDEQVMREALGTAKAKKPLIYAATRDNIDAFGIIARESGCPLAVKGDGLEETAALAEKLTAMGLKDLVLDPSSRDMKTALHDEIIIRRAALVNKFKPFGFPTIAFPCAMAKDLMDETLIAATLLPKYAGILVLSDFEGESLFPILLQRLNIYTDPQRPMTTQEGIYPVNNPDESSPVLVTCNFSLTYFIVSSEIENSRVGAWLCIMDT